MLETEETDPFRSQSQWSPALSIKTAMLSLQALLSSPEPSDPQDAVVAKQYISDYEEFKTTAKAWTVILRLTQQLQNTPKRKSARRR